MAEIMRVSDAAWDEVVRRVRYYSKDRWERLPPEEREWLLKHTTASWDECVHVERELQARANKPPTSA